MLDREGFRPNVGIVLLNSRNQVFWGKRLRTHSWQFPQGGIKYGESPEQAMFRELHEEVGLLPDHVRILARTRDWLRYEVPEHYIRKDARGHYRGQKQIWFLLKLVGRDCDMNLRATNHPEFDAWRWNDYWVPLDVVIEFKRGVYQLALTELARFLPKTNYHNRYLRGGPRGPREEWIPPAPNDDALLHGLNGGRCSEAGHAAELIVATAPLAVAVAEPANDALAVRPLGEDAAGGHPA